MFKTWKGTLFLFLYAPLLSGTILNLYARQAAQSQESRCSEIRISIRQIDGRPISGAMVRFDGGQILRSDARGMASINCAPAFHNRLYLDVQAQGFRPSTKVVSQSQGSVEIVLQEDGSSHQFSKDTVTAEELSRDTQARSEQLQEEGLKALNRADPGSAEHLLQQALELTPSDWTIYNNIGVSKARMKQPNSAAVWFERGLALAPHDFTIAGNLGLIRWLQGRIEESYSLLERAISHGYSNPVAHYAIGIICLQKGLPSRAAEHLSKVKDRQLPYRDLFLSFALRGEGKLGAAMKYYGKFLKMKPVQYASASYDFGPSGTSQ